MIHLDATRRDEAIAALSDSVGQPLVIGPGWDVLAVVDGSVIGAVLVSGSEVHIGITRPCFLRGLMRQVIAGQVRKFGISITKVRESHAIGHKFVQRIGFKPVKTVDGLVHYELKELNYA